MSAGLSYRAGLADAAEERRALSGIPALPAHFARDRVPAQAFALSDLPQWQTDPILVDTVGSYPDSRQFCGVEGSEDTLAAKGRTWFEHAMCGGVEALPEDFFESPPYLHLSGRSYVLMALTADPGRYGTREWLAAHKQYVHVSELPDVARLGVRLDAAETLAARLGAEGLRALALGQSPVIAGERLLVAMHGSGSPGGTTYGVYPLSAWERFLGGTRWSSAPSRPGDRCLAVVGAVCFRPAPVGLGQWAGRAMGLGAASLVLLALAAVRSGLVRLQARRREKEARLFMLQTLSHEIRTPLTTLALSLEPLRRRFDDLPEDAQPAFLRLCDGVQRLQRVVAASTQYLRGQVGEREIALEAVELASADELVQSVLDGYDRPIELRPLGVPTAVRLDPYWVGVCIKNLVDNALVHGAEPWLVSLARSGRSLVVTVQDAGPGPSLDLDQMTAPFSRSNASPGLGFGLAVVQRLVTAMGGELALSLHPTRFSISLPVVVS